MTGWTTDVHLLEDEFLQSRQEGRDSRVLAELKRKFAGLDRGDHAALESLWREVQDVPQVADFPFFEPSDLATIQAERGAGPRQLPMGLDDGALFDRMNGAWHGRAVGCALGRPVECFVNANDAITNRQRIKRYLTGISPDEYPIRGFIPAASPASGETGEANCKASTRESIAFMESDDDIRYTVLNQTVLLEKGAAFTTVDVARAWTGMLGYGQICTAETQAYRNLVMAYPRNLDWDSAEHVDWDWVATNHNPYREWIGAQIRADSWGYAAPGHPERAAVFAWRDARMTHVKNGIYGAMFCAAMIAAAFALPDPLAVVEAGLAEIPRRSRLHADIRATIEICRAHGFAASEFEAVHDQIEARLGHYHWVHTNNNAALVVAALLLGGDDFERAVTIAVMGGWDTDCNGATVGSIWGAMFGASRLPKKWTAPLHDTLYSGIPGYHPIAIGECARKSLAIAQTVRLSPP